MVEQEEAPRAYTAEEFKDALIQHIYYVGMHWAKSTKWDEKANRWSDEPLSTKEAIEGFIHSIFATFDGASSALPAFTISPCPHPDDKQYHIDEGENYYDPEVNLDEFSLHDEYGAFLRRMKGE